jgi:hypothetical protein
MAMPKVSCGLDFLSRNLPLPAPLGLIRKPPCSALPGAICGAFFILIQCSKVPNPNAFLTPFIRKLASGTANFGTCFCAIRLRDRTERNIFFNWEDRMFLFAFRRVTAWVVLLAGILAAPSFAQTGAITNLLQVGPRTYLGIQMEDVTSGKLSEYKLNSERGVIVRSVIKGSPAEAANLKEGDVILEFGGFQVWSSAQLARLVEDTPAGRKVELAIIRDGKRMDLTAQVASRDDRTFNDRMVFPRDFLGNEGPSNRFFYRIPGAEETAAPKPKLGVTLQPLTDQLAEYFGVPEKKGALISSVSADSPCSGKLKSGDVIISFDGKSVEDPEDLSRLVRDKEGSVTLKIIREKKEMTVIVNLPADSNSNSKGYRL